MRCPLCVNAGAAHELHIDNARPEPNLKLVASWYDEKDLLHQHDSQEIPMHLRCSNGHHFTVRWLSRCPVRVCEWNKNVLVTTGVGWPEVPKQEPT